MYLQSVGWNCDEKINHLYCHLRFYVCGLGIPNDFGHQGKQCGTSPGSICVARMSHQLCDSMYTFVVCDSQDESEQGRIQGALYSVQALASALGPVAMRWIYGLTKDGALMGPGTMFIFASAFYIIAVYCACLLPVGGRSKLREVPLFKSFL
jgi:hypothetical protein